MTDVFISGRNGYHTYRIPAVVTTKKGTVLAFCEGRKHSRSDSGDIDLILKRSGDGGETWQRRQVIWDDGSNTCGNPCPVVDQQTGTIWLPFCRNNDRVFMTHSDDDGKTWAEPLEITKDVKKPEWDWYATGPGHGIQLSDGRLVIPSDCRERGRKDGIRGDGHSLAFYSDDHGKTWKLGGVTGEGMNECEVVELADGRLLLSMRNYFGKNQRALATSKDRGQSWSKPRPHKQVYCPTCQSSIHRYSLKPKNIILYCGPGGPGRNNLTVRISYDEGKTWAASRIVHAGPSAYSCLTALPDGTFACLFEGGAGDPYEKIIFARLTLDWLEDAK